MLVVADWNVLGLESVLPIVRHQINPKVCVESQLSLVNFRNGYSADVHPGEIIHSRHVAENKSVSAIFAIGGVGVWRRFAKFFKRVKYGRIGEKIGKSIVTG
jgi:hypothetical protein